MPRIRLDSLVKRYGATDVIHGIDLETDDNEFTVLVGPSGCGKSTTLRMIAGLEEVSGGEIWIDDRPVSGLEPKERDVAMVFQDYALYPHMNVARNMSFALRLAKRPRKEIDAKVGEVAEMLGLQGMLHRKPAELSGGQRQRVAMGRALVRDASTFLFDEPLSNLDAKLRGQMRAELAVMSQRIEKSMVYVTHDQIEAMTLGQRIVVMQAGHIRQQGTAEELFSRPNSRFVAGFIGSPPMNFLDGVVERADGRLAVRGDAFLLPLPPALAARVERADPAAVTLGVRPSDLEPAPEGAAGGVFRLEVLVSEYVGAQSVAMGRCGADTLSVELKSSTRPVPGERLAFVPAPEGIHLFDRETDLAL